MNAMQPGDQSESDFNGLGVSREEYAEVMKELAEEAEVAEMIGIGADFR